MDLQDAVTQIRDEIKENRKLNSATHDAMIHYQHEQEAIRKEIEGLRKRQDESDSIIEKHSQELGKLTNINAKMLVVVTGSIWLLGALLKYLIGLLANNISIGGWMVK